MRRLALMCCAGLLAAGCSGQESPPPKTNSATAPANAQPAATPVRQDPNDPWRVIESFEIGRELYVRSLAVDRVNNALWVGTSAGVHEVDLASLNVRKTYTRSDGLANEYVFAMLVDRDGNKWFGTNGGGAARLAGDKWRVFFPMHGLADYWVYSFGQQRDGTLWIGTWAGVNRLGKSGKFETFVKELVNEWVYGIAVDAQDRVWFGTEGGVSMYDGTWHAWTHKEGLGAPNEDRLPISFNTGLGTRSRHDLSLMAEGQATYNPNYVFSIHAARDGAVWAGTWGGGVSRFDGQRWTSYTTRQGLAGNVVFSIAEADDGTLWFGTDHGVSRFDGKTWHSYGKANGLLSNNVYAVAVSPANEVWVGTRGAVSRLGMADNKQTSKPK